MTPDQFGELVATRWLDLDGERAIQIVLDAPKVEANGDASCRVQMFGLGPDHDHVRTAWGVDGFQALELAFRMIGAILETCEEGRAGRITWEGGSAPGDLGFPRLPAIE